jgi:hypothetical protein
MRLDLIEAAANTALGLLFGWLILRAFGMPGERALAAQGAFVAISYVRSFILRRVFRRVGEWKK